MLNPWQSLPLPPRPSVERYRKLAKQLVKAAQTDSIGEWASRHASRPIEEFAREKMAESRPRLTAAQFVIARAHGFESWPKFHKHVAAMAKKGSAVERFEAAADAIVNGKIGVLKRLLREDPELIRARSTRAHRATLLHYAAANGVEQYRQKTPNNIVRIMELLIAYGAEIDATAELYGGGATTLGLAATSVFPKRAGVQEELIQLLLDHGATIGDTARGCLWNGQGEAAAYLAERGAPLTLESAAGVGRLDVVESYFKDGAKPPRDEMRAGFLLGCAWGRANVVEFLLARGADPAWCRKDGQTALHWAVIGGHLEIVRILLRLDPPLEAVNMHGGTVLGQTLWSAAHGGNWEKYIAILEELTAAGARVPEKHVPVNERIDAWLTQHGSHPEPSWHWPGEEPE